MELFITDNKQDREAEKEDRKEINDFLATPDVENIFGLYDKSLISMHKFYAS